MPEEFWATNPLVLIHPKYLHRFFPSDRLHIAARMNAVMRCALYISILISTIRKEPIWMLIPLITAGVTASWMYHEDPHIFSKSSRNHHVHYHDRDDDDEDRGTKPIVEDIFNHYNDSSSYNSENQDIEALANEIIKKEIHKYPKKDLRRKHDRNKSTSNDPRLIGKYSPDPRLFQDMDTSIQKMQRDRAIVTSSVAGGIPDTPKFSRKMMKMDEKKTKSRHQHS